MMGDSIKAKEESSFLVFAWRTLYHTSKEARELAALVCLHFHITGIEGYASAVQGFKGFITSLQNRFEREKSDHLAWSTAQHDLINVINALRGTATRLEQTLTILSQSTPPRGFTSHEGGSPPPGYWDWLKDKIMDFQEVQQETSIANGIEASLPIIHRLHATPDFPYTAALLLCGHPIGNPAHSKGLRFWQLLEKVRAKLIEDCGMIHRDHRITNNTTEEIQLKKFVEKMAREFDAVFQYLETEFRKRTAAA